MDSLRPEKLVSGRSDYFRIRLFLVAALFRNIIKEIIAVIQRCIHINVAYDASGHLLGHIISKLAVFGNRQELVSLARVAFQFKLCTLDRVESRRGIRKAFIVVAFIGRGSDTGRCGSAGRCDGGCAEEGV